MFYYYFVFINYLTFRSNKFVILFVFITKRNLLILYLGHVVFIWFHFKKQNETKKNEKKKNIRKINSNSTKRKQKQNEQNQNMIFGQNNKTEITKESKHKIKLKK